jgi:hypothetical protein
MLTVPVFNPFTAILIRRSTNLGVVTMATPNLKWKRLPPTTPLLKVPQTGPPRTTMDGAVLKIPAMTGA